MEKYRRKDRKDVAQSRDCYRKIPEKISLKIWTLRNRNRFSKKSFRGVLTPYLGYLRTKFGTNKTSRLGVSLYTEIETDRLADKVFVFLLLEIMFIIKFFFSLLACKF